VKKLFLRWFVNNNKFAKKSKTINKKYLFMKRLFLFLAITFLFLGISYAQTPNRTAIDVFPYEEGFESNGNNLPLGWSQEVVTGYTEHWKVFRVSETSAQPATVHGGQYKAVVYVAAPPFNGNKNRLVMPEFDLTALSSPVLKFWHTQLNSAALRVFYKTSASGTWTLLEEYLTDVPNWSEKTIALVNPSATYYIAFESEARMGGGLQLDDVSVLNASSDIDGELTAIIQPVSGYNLSAAESVKVSIKNNSSGSLTNFGIELKLGTAVVATETYTETIASYAEVEYTFNATLDLSTPGTYQVTVSLDIPGDVVPANNSKTVTVVNTFWEDIFDANLLSITSPIEGTYVNLPASIPVKAIIKNDGNVPLTGFTMKLELDDTTIANETYSGTPIQPGANYTYTFTQTLDLSAEATYNITVTAIVAGDPTPANNSKTIQVTNTISVGLVNVTLVAGDVWGDGSGFQMLLDPTATAYGTLFPAQGYAILAPCGVQNLYQQFPYKIPENADSNCATSNVVLNNSITVQIPTGVYDFVICNPRTVAGQIMLPTGGSFSCVNDFYFQQGIHYTFTVTLVPPAGPARVTLSEQAANMDVPRMINNLTVTPDAGGALSANVSWENPTLTMGGVMLTDFTAVKVYLNNGLAHTVSNPVAGANESVTIPVPEPGTYTFKVVPENTAGTGAPQSVTKWVGNEFAITTFPWIEGFESETFPPVGWNRKIQQGFSKWEKNTQTTSNFFVYNGNASAFHNYADLSAGTQESWLVTPKIVLPSTGSYGLEFWSNFYYANYADINDVMISTTGNNPAIHEFVLLKHLQGGEVVNSTWQEIKISLNEYLGQGVYIAFRYRAIFGPRWFIDDVKVSEVYTIDATVEKTYAPLKAMVDEPFKIKAVVKNVGFEVLSNYTVALTNTQGNAITASYPGPTLNPEETAIVELMWTPTTAGTQYIHAKVTAPGDVNSSNDLSPAFNVNVLPAGNSFTGTVGNGNYGDVMLPFSFWYNVSRVQAIYFDHELIGKPGAITQIQYTNNFVTSGGAMNKHVKIWMLNSPKTELNTWHFPLSDFVKVFDGNVNFPMGQNLITIQLDEPFIYTGQNLLVMSDRIYTENYFGLGDVFNCTITPDFPNRTRSYYSSSDVNLEMLEYLSYGAGANRHPNTNFTFVLALSSMSGKVTDGTNPVSDVSIQIEGSYLKTSTDANGNYSFENLMPGNYKLKLSKHGYYDKTTDAVNLTPHENTVFDIVMPPLPRYTVSGKVTGNDKPNGIANATVRLSGYDDFSITTNANGEYAMQYVYGEKQYAIVAEATGYESNFSNVNVIADVTCDIVLNEIAYHAVEPVAKIVGENVEISWLLPGTWVPRTYILDDGTAEAGNAWPEEVASHSSGNIFEVNEAGEITSVDVYGVAAEGVTGRPQTIRIYNEKREVVGESDEFILQADDWINVPLNNVPYSGIFYAMLYCPRAFTGKSHFLGLDQDGPYAQFDHIAWTCQYGFWYNYNEYYRPGIFMIRVNATSTAKSVTYGPGSTIVASDNVEIGLTSEIFTNSFSIAPPLDRGGARTFENYSVYRLIPGQPENAWTLLSDNVTESPYTDANWPNLPLGDYQWAVKVNYSNSVVSEPRLTNILERLLGINGNNISNIQLYPNPFTNIIYVSHPELVKNVQIVDIMGKIVKQISFTGKYFTTENLGTGIYFVTIESITGDRTIYKMVKN
jgi:hypothetical protein